MNLLNPFMFAGGGGGGTSYTNPLGSGDRTALMSVSKAAGLTMTGTLTLFIDGAKANGLYFNPAQTVDSSLYIDFDFGTSHLVDEIKFYQSLSADTQGVWEALASDDLSGFTSMGSSFTLGGFSGTSNPQIITEVNGNTTPGRYMRIRGVSGMTNTGPYTIQFEFKISA